MNATTGLNTDFNAAQLVPGGYIQSLKVSKLFGRYDYALTFHEFNILIGSNGVGKTTLLKLMWYMISGNLRQALKEIPFEEVVLITLGGEKIRLSKRAPVATDTRRDGSRITNPVVCDAVIVKKGGEIIFSRTGIPLEELDSELQAKSPTMSNISYFMPVFRRPGSGFGLENSGIEDAFRHIKESLDSYQHEIYIHADSSDVIMAITNTLVRNNMRKSNIDNERKEKINQILEINGNITSGEFSNIEIWYNSKISEIDSNIKKLHTYIDYLFWDKAIVIPVQAGNDDFVLGSSERKVTIGQLSSGEENLLSLLIYNATYIEAMFFIDEPEMFLHPDWQRELVRILKEQNPTNQFYMATHSPAIASSLHSGVIDLDAELRKQGFDI